ncbi:MAG: type II toxin-antitoxin system RelE/ParE family toxin [Acidobacteriota bacterium]|nr:type II toxin-antitoxin system RelE/ParE family toxin [Acidobacteriota bacterium]
MIESFADGEAEKIFHRQPSRLYGSLQKAISRKLLMLHGARLLSDLTHPPGNRLEALRGDRKGQHSMRINDQYRVCFIWEEPYAHEIEIAD